MRKTLVFILIVIAFVFVSCSKTVFTVDSSSLHRYVDLAMDSGGNITSYKEKMVLSTLFSDDDLNYSFQIKTPDKALVWEGNFSSNEAELGITAGATFPSGDYPVIFYGDNGTEINDILHLSKIDKDFPYISKDLKLASDYEVSIVEYDKDNIELKRESRAVKGYKVSPECCKVYLSYTDRYLNRIRISQKLT